MPSGNTVPVLGVLKVVPYRYSVRIVGGATGTRVVVGGRRETVEVSKHGPNRLS